MAPCLPMVILEYWDPPEDDRKSWASAYDRALFVGIIIGVGLDCCKIVGQGRAPLEAPALMLALQVACAIVLRPRPSRVPPRKNQGAEQTSDPPDSGSEPSDELPV